MAVGAIEEILMDEEFVRIQTAFCERHCGRRMACKRVSVVVIGVDCASISDIHGGRGE